MIDQRSEELEALLVSPRVGLVTHLIPQERAAEEPVPPYLYTATLANFDFRSLPRSQRLNAGKGRTAPEAKIAALGEAVERYSAYHWDATRVWVGHAPAGAITPTDCVLYAEHQYAVVPYRRWSPDVETSWIEGVELPSRAAVALPAALVYLVSALPRPEDYVTSITSNGLAAGADLTRAVVGGLYELIERDALMIAWMNRLPATEIETPSAGCYSAPIIRHYNRFGVNVRLLVLPTDQRPTVVLAIADNPPGEGPARVVGMGCDLDPIAAVDKAVFEMCQARPSEAARFKASDSASRLRRYEDVRELDDHPAFHALRENQAEMSFLADGDRRVRLADLARPGSMDPDDVLEVIVGGLRDAGARVAYVDITAADVASTGLRVVRCIATGLQPIHFGYGEARLGGRRLFEAPVRWGLRERPLTAGELNPCPHPLA